MIVIEDVPGGPGWKIRGSDLRPEITDLSTFRAAVRDDPLRPAIELLWAGSPREALDLLTGREQTRRTRALIADCHRDLGEAAAAVDTYDELVTETIGTRGEAAMRQHRGKALLAADRTAEALTDFRAAAGLRGGDPDLLASSEQAIAFARAVRESTATGGTP